MTQTTNRFLDDLARLMTDAAGAADGLKREVTGVMRAQAERLLNEMDVVQREEFEAVKAMAEKARAENELLKRASPRSRPSSPHADAQRRLRTLKTYPRRTSPASAFMPTKPCFVALVPRPATLAVDEGVGELATRRGLCFRRVGPRLSLFLCCRCVVIFGYEKPLDQTGKTYVG